MTTISENKIANASVNVAVALDETNKLANNVFDHRSIELLRIDNNAIAVIRSNTKKTTNIFTTHNQWLLLLTIQQSIMPLMVRYAKTRTDRPMFIATTCVFIMEIIRILICSIALTYHYCSFTRFIHKTYHTLVSNPMETIKFFVPAFIYAIQNNLYYIALAHIDATVYSITYQLRILTTAFLSIVMLHRIIAPMQWFALFISIVGVAIVQYEQHRTSVSLHHRSTESTNTVIGFVAVIAMCWTSAIAGVYIEKVLKTSNADLWLQNIRLSLVTLPFSCLAMLIADSDNIYRDGIFYGWDWLIWLITTSSSLGGLLVSAVVKYADNIKKTYCQSIAIVGTAIGSVIILNDFVPTVAAIIGMSLVLLSAYVYVIFQPKSK